jgi:hypothetical protein
MICPSQKIEILLPDGFESEHIFDNWYSILPQVLPVIYASAVYRWDINIHETTLIEFDKKLVFSKYSFYASPKFHFIQHCKR